MAWFTTLVTVPTRAISLVAVVSIGFGAATLLANDQWPVLLANPDLIVDAVDYFAGPATSHALDLAGACASLAVLAVMVFQMVPLARDMHEFGDVSAILAIPKIVYWIPVLLGIGGSALMTLVFILRWRRKA